MAITHLRGTDVQTSGELPALGSTAPDATLVGQDLSDVTIAEYRGRTVVLNIFPSVDTGTCATSVRTFNQYAANLPGTIVICVSNDLPFAMKRFCAAEGIDNVVTGSAFRSDFGASYGVTLVDSPMAGLLARAVVVIDANGVVTYTQLVDEIGSEPDYEAAIAALS